METYKNYSLKATDSIANITDMIKYPLSKRRMARKLQEDSINPKTLNLLARARSL